MPATNANSLWASPLTVTIASLGADKPLTDGGYTQCRRLTAGAVGNLAVVYKDQNGNDITDILSFSFVGQEAFVSPYKLLAAGTTTVFPLRISY